MACIHEHSPSDVSVDPSMAKLKDRVARDQEHSPAGQQQPWGRRPAIQVSGSSRGSSRGSPQSSRAMSL